MLSYRKRFDAINDNWDHTQSRLVCDEDDLKNSLDPDEYNRKLMFQSASLIDSFILLILFSAFILAIIA